MATYTSIPTFTSGQVLTSAVMNDVKDNLDLTNAQSAYPYRNLLYNGAMQVTQRGTNTAGITTNGYFTADRFWFQCATTGTWTQSVENDAPTGSGLRKSLKLLCTTADASPAAGDLAAVAQLLEGQDLQRIAKGTSSAQQLTLSFWVKSNVTGTHTVLVYDADNSRATSFAYTISVSGTWEQKTILIPADMTGALDNDNNQSLAIYWHLAAGSNFTSGSLQSVWGTYSATGRAVGQVNVASAINNYWQVTGVQLEVGSVSTPFEFLPYGDELARCQRYFYLLASGTSKSLSVGYYYNSADVRTVVNFPVSMRSAPVLNATSGTDYYTIERNGAIDRFNSFTITRAHENGTLMYNNTEVSGTAGQAGELFTSNASASIGFSAEL